MTHHDDSIFSVRFVGAQLDRRNMPIYELGHVFIGVQRLFHKAYLAEQERLEKRAFPEKAERRTLALQIRNHEKGSDVYNLIPFLGDPSVIATFKPLVHFVLSGLGSYARKQVLEKLKEKLTGKEHEKTQIYIGSIHAEVVNIVDRIHGVGGCESIQIGCPKFDLPKVDLTAETRDYAHHVADEFYLGAVQTIVGEAYKLYPNISMIEIRKLPGNKKCKLFLQEKDFDEVRYGQIKSPFLTVTGRPRFRVGTERRSFDEFEVTQINSIDDSQNPSE